MIEEISVPADNVIGFCIAGKVEKQDMTKVIDRIKTVLASHDTFNIYVEIKEFDGVSLGVILEKIKALSTLTKFKKEAIVSSKEWIKKFTAIADKLFPSIEVKHFSFEEKHQALKWVQEP
ncbi:MAG: STAS/SEC14 domain-containing protein [Prochloron sp. SP5CPC1]|nr:STAS/SEC14 domain-containing protein [Candidatus Paraprochloron terpiosi SP5CPC1]